MLDATTTDVRPAHDTKHIPVLLYPLVVPATGTNLTLTLAQTTDGRTNGSALWLGAQCLSHYLIHAHTRRTDNARCRILNAIELGSGIGLTALTLATLGYRVLATDLPIVIDSVLATNVARNTHMLPPGSGDVHVRALDWSVPPDAWSWTHPSAVATPSSSPAPTIHTASPAPAPPFDLIVTADTVYSSTLLTPLLRTLHALSSLSLATSCSRRPPPIYICLERRDPVLVDSMLSEARSTWGFSVDRVPHRKILRAMKKGGIDWSLADWEDIEIWKLVLQVPH